MLLPEPLTQALSIIAKERLNLSDEKVTQAQIYAAIGHLGFVREYRLDAKNIPDLFFEGIAIEVKIKGTKANIFRQCERYCAFDEVKYLVVCTNKAMGLPGVINDKPIFFINIGKAWL